MTIYLNNEKVPIRIFSGGEVNVNVNGLMSPYDGNKIFAVIRNSDDILAFILTVDAIRQENPSAIITAHIPYMPYARQDRVCNKGEAFSAKVIADIINSLKLDMVYVNVAHSDVIVNLINNCKNIPLYIDLSSMGYSTDIFIMCADEGMFERRKIIPGLSGKILYASKKRDPMTGEITNVSFSGDIVNRDILVIDDICDGGRSFVELAKVLKARGANKLHLYVCFGIFKFSGHVALQLCDYYDSIRCKFDFRNEVWRNEL
jgi:ribose-phosphate pyrophosphokinase